MPKQIYADSEFTIDETLSREDVVERLVFLDDKAFQAFGDWIDLLMAAWNDAVDERDQRDTRDGN